MVSACLLGVRCRYDGEHAACAGVCAYAESEQVVPLCPEQLGGLPTPRPAADLTGGDGRAVLSGTASLVTRDGGDSTGSFVRGAGEALRVARLVGSPLAIMKDRSPSCGLAARVCGRRPGVGPGVTAALFTAHGIEVVEVGRDTVFPTPAFLEALERVGAERI